MSSPIIHAIWATKSPFVPYQPEIVSIGQTLVSLYPKVDLSMTNADKALAFQHNKTVLASADLNQRTHILTLAEQLNLMLMTKSSLADWEQKLSPNWANFANLTILSWHKAKGDFIMDTTSASDPSTIKPVKDGKREECRSAGIKFICIQLELDYSDLATPAGPAASNTVLWGEYYIQLLQNTKDITDNKNTQYHLTTYLSGDDICTLPLADAMRTILDVTHQDGPYDLLVPSFNLTLCQTDSTAVYGKLKLMVVPLASDTIVKP
jgi:hypothetical protein